VRLKSRNSVFVLYCTTVCILAVSVDICKLRGYRQHACHVLNQFPVLAEATLLERRTRGTPHPQSFCGARKGAMAQFSLSEQKCHLCMKHTERHCRHSKATLLLNAPTLKKDCVTTAVCEVWEWTRGFCYRILCRSRSCGACYTIHSSPLKAWKLQTEAFSEKNW
jgi:hypothetical protein